MAGDCLTSIYAYELSFNITNCRRNHFHQSNIAEDEVMPPK